MVFVNEILISIWKWIAVKWNVILSKFQEIVEGRGAWHAAVPGLQTVAHDIATEQQ